MCDCLSLSGVDSFSDLKNLIFDFIRKLTSEQLAAIQGEVGAGVSLLGDYTTVAAYVEHFSKPQTSVDALVVRATAVLLQRQIIVNVYDEKHGFCWREVTSANYKKSSVTTATTHVGLW
jgi:hypothetical protein